MLIAKQDLARLLAATTRAIEARNTIPILATVRLVAGNGTLTVTATDLDIEVAATAPVDGELAACVDGKLFNAAVTKAPGDIELTAEAGHLIVKSGRSRIKLPTLPVDDFPSFAAGDLAVTFDIDLAALVAPVAFAMSQEPTRYYLNGVYLHNPGSALVAVATDGHRMVVHKAETVGDIPPVILPRKLVGILPKGTVTVSLSGTKVRVAAPDCTITSKLIDGTFPDYQRVIPNDNDNVIEVDGKALASAAGRVALVATERAPGLRLNVANDEIALWVGGAGEASDVVPAAYSGEPIEIGFNSKYVEETIANLPAGNVKLALKDGGTPALFTSPANDGLLSVLMPRRV